MSPGNGCGSVNSQQPSCSPPQMKNVKEKKSGQLVNISESKHQGSVPGGQSPALPCEWAVGSLFQ